MSKTKQLNDALISLQYTHERHTEEISKLQEVYNEHAVNHQYLLEVVADLEKSIRLLKNKAQVVSINVYKDLKHRLSVCKTNIENTKLNMDNVRKLLTYNQNMCKNAEVEMASVQKELASFGKLCKLDDHTRNYPTN